MPHNMICKQSVFSKRNVGTPKHRPRPRYNGCINGDSPSEAEAIHDIIWDPASPPPTWNGKGAGESVRVVEISEIVNRIAPNDEKPVDKDSVLQWIGDTAIPCTPEIQQPRVRRCSARRQSNNVEDLMKLAKQFDLNMTRQHKERVQNVEGTNCKVLPKLNKLTATCPESQSNGASVGDVKRPSHEEELHALFDGPTQHLSGRLSPPSVNSSQESRTEKTASHGIRPDTSDCKNLPDDAQVSKLDFDDDWENDDLLNDLFVQEVTQNPQLLDSCTKKTNSQIPSKKCEPTVLSSSPGSSSRAECSQSEQITSHYTRILSESCKNSCTFRSESPVQSFALKELPKTGPYLVNAHLDYQKTYVLGVKQQMVMTHDGLAAKNIDSSTGPSGRDLDSLWGDGDNDDDLLYQACDDLERISASQEQQKHKNSTSSSCNSPEVPLSITTSSSNMSRNSTTIQSQQPTDYKQHVWGFARSHSIPGASGIYVNKKNLSESTSASPVNHYLQNKRQQYHFTKLRNATEASEEYSYHPTFKRHQSDPGALRNK
ncbi:ewing's tumor-associated antigen 1-like, partial [Clarias magur]